jgi:hypothetical protein
MCYKRDKEMDQLLLFSFRSSRIIKEKVQKKKCLSDRD